MSANRRLWIVKGQALMHTYEQTHKALQVLTRSLTLRNRGVWQVFIENDIAGTMRGHRIIVSKCAGDG